MPVWSIPSTIRRVSRDRAFCAVKRLRGSLVVWRGHHWKIADREWNRNDKEWNYDLVPV